MNYDYKDSKNILNIRGSCKWKPEYLPLNQEHGKENKKNLQNHLHKHFYSKRDNKQNDYAIS